MKHDLTDFARAGYAGLANMHLRSSSVWYAHELGRYLRSSGRGEPRDVSMGRGHLIHANDMMFKIVEPRGFDVMFDRVR